jgi:hypothetical protein
MLYVYRCTAYLSVPGCVKFQDMPWTLYRQTYCTTDNVTDIGMIKGVGDRNDKGVSGRVDVEHR